MVDWIAIPTERFAIVIFKGYLRSVWSSASLSRTS